MTTLAFSETSKCQRALFGAAKGSPRVKIIRKRPSFKWDSQKHDTAHKSKAFSRRNAPIYKGIGE
jgi:hypothetical protein